MVALVDQGRRTFIAATTLLIGRAVKITGDNTVGYAGVGESFIGITTDVAIAGGPVSMKLNNSAGSIEVSLADAVSAGELLGVANSAGQFGTATAGDCQYRAMRAGPANGFVEAAICRSVGALPGEQEARAALGLAATKAIRQASCLYQNSSDKTDNDNAKDWSGNSRTPLLKSSPCPILTAATGIDSAVGGPMSAQGALTLAGWVFFDTINAAEEIWSTNTTQELRIDSSGNLLFTEPRSGGFVQNTGGVLVTGQWYHIGFTYDGSTASGSTPATVVLYINGVARGTTWTTPYNNALAATLQTYTGWSFGSRTDNTLPLKGKMMNWRCYQSVLSGAQMAALAAHNPPAGAVSNWRMTERGGTYAYDCIGTNHLTYTGTVTWGTQDLLHDAFDYGATVFLNGATTNTYAIVPHKEDLSAISYASFLPFASSNLVGDFAPGLFEGNVTKIDFSNGGAYGGLGLETNYGFGDTRTTPRWRKNTEHTLVKFARAATAKKIVFYGTSLTLGTGGAWAADITAWLNDRNNVITAVNAASSGQQSSWGIANLDTLVVTENPDFIFLETFAMNDADNQLTPVSVAQHITNVTNMITDIQAGLPDAKIYLMTMNPTTAATANGNARHPNLADYYAADRVIATGYPSSVLELLDFHAMWTALPQATQDAAITDGVHPTSGACDTYITPYLKSFLVGSSERYYYLFEP